MRDTSDSGSISSSPSRSLSDFKGANHLKKERDLSYNGIKIVTIDFLPTKKKTPMHFKLYESTLQEVRKKLIIIRIQILKKPRPRLHIFLIINKMTLINLFLLRHLRKKLTYTKQPITS
jgi:hypothetical protein